MYAEACILQANLFGGKRNQIDSNSVLSEIIKTFTKFPYSFSCFSLCHHQSKALSPFCVHLQTEQQSIAFTTGDWDGSSPDLYFARLRCVELQCTNK